MQLLIEAEDEDEVDEGESNSNETNLSNLSASKRSTKAGYLTSKDAKKGGDNLKRGGRNTKKSVKAARGSDYLILYATKAFIYLWHAFT